MLGCYQSIDFMGDFTRGKRDETSGIWGFTIDQVWWGYIYVEKVSCC